MSNPTATQPTIVRTEVIVSTYNNPMALNYVLLALAGQRNADFMVCVADDGSGEPTHALLESWSRRRLSPIPLRHIWQPDDGFRKNTILNKAIDSSQADYLIFIDGDCVARPDFIACHIARRAEGAFLSGGMIRLPDRSTSALSEQGIGSGEVFRLNWIFAQIGLRKLSVLLKAAVLPMVLASKLEWITPVKRTWNGANSSAWRRDLIAVNGFDESLRYGAEDVEMGARLSNHGIVGQHIRYSTCLLHIEHLRGYADANIVQRNKAYVREVRQSGIDWTANGIVKLAARPVAEIEYDQLLSSER
ncbi:glycosyltransferase [Candidatus Nitrotoga arctica]|uniref:Glycosyl transferase family 2 n=1 Tax=Candidatus Nitrotoga arctica TaxID=453162 RepID=A0ABN8AII9_9PROT|nr:glycosyltransferase [Candidatus Nitrotoga arctica]CAG9932548.1 Glycosyl transferase family 2 [Candidatus Nitrotoga arctica]